MRAIVEELNGALLPHGWRIGTLGWEQRGPAAGRAQADISERQRSTGSPDLWLYFKRPIEDPDEDARDDGQLARVLSFRHEVEDGELAFYKTFEHVDQFTSLVRARVLAEVIERTGLTRTDIGVVAIDWAAAYEQEPVDLIPDGRGRLQLVEELEASRPADAARLLVALAEDLARQGFAQSAEDLRQRASSPSFAAPASSPSASCTRAGSASKRSSPVASASWFTVLVAVLPVSNGLTSHSARSQRERTRREDRHLRSSTSYGTTSSQRRRRHSARRFSRF